jgi:hypothetical protein
MKKSLIIVALATVVALTTLGFTVNNKPKSVEQATAEQEPSMVKPVINEAQF